MTEIVHAGPMVQRRSMAQRSREVLRYEALDIAEELVLGCGPRGLSMRELAGRVGVSRQTLYSEFGDRGGVAAALVLRCTDRFLDRIETALAAEDDLYAAWVAAVGAAITESSANPLVKALLTGEGAAPELFGAESGPIVAAATDRSVAYLRRAFPDLDPDAVALAAETATRLTVSHIVLPRHPPEQVAEQVATVVVAILARDVEP
ncbi:TetR/AcrR family transcriptional regulator [Pseudonocardia sp. KRD291]|uniref:TetR/AcrR family transcriptional regulator n=1 Tax=Pseudonocardia sp. KRD291 TaxID=2792007 RepID=UPI001C4A4A4D|nr:TetR/AcrR family transcriptional regulator [Pseudonocardia sp. KRD291]MBW0104203.1 TetR/AcrR family transcriptional regulator [Pseudonocardia sp. KRD291]